MQLKRLRRSSRPEAAAGRCPRSPLDEAGKYVAGAYVVFLALIVIYVAIIAAEDRADRAASSPS